MTSAATPNLTIVVFFMTCNLTAGFGSPAHFCPNRLYGCLDCCQNPVNCLLDSAAGISAIDLRTARSLGVHLGNRQIVQGVNGQSFAYRVNDLQAVCGGIALPKSVLAVDLRALSDRCDQPVDGILG